MHVVSLGRLADWLHAAAIRPHHQDAERGEAYLGRHHDSAPVRTPERLLLRVVIARASEPSVAMSQSWKVPV
jgi:hypothetical protein